MLRKFFLTLKYWLQGDDWETATEFAEYITRWTRNREDQIKAMRFIKRSKL
jgi:hypothetical protein